MLIIGDITYALMNTSAHAMLTQLRAVRADAFCERKLLRFTTPTSRSSTISACVRSTMTSPSTRGDPIR